MSGTKSGAAKGKKKLLARDPNFYKKIGAKGGTATPSEKRTFYTDRKLASASGKKGGKVSRRPKVVK